MAVRVLVRPLWKASQHQLQWGPGGALQYTVGAGVRVGAWVRVGVVGVGALVESTVLRAKTSAFRSQLRTHPTLHHYAHQDSGLEHHHQGWGQLDDPSLLPMPMHLRVPPLAHPVQGGGFDHHHRCPLCRSLALADPCHGPTHRAVAPTHAAAVRASLNLPWSPIDTLNSDSPLSGLGVQAGAQFATAHRHAPWQF